jgi:hypothetical protein
MGAGQLAVSVFSAFYVGFRLPNLWSQNYFIPGLFDGIWRRGLLGTLLTPFDPLRFRYAFVAALQALIFVALVTILVRQAYARGVATSCIAIAFLLAPTGGYLFHEIGYVDQVQYLILVLALGLRTPGYGLLLMVLSLFIHELALFTTVPLYLARFVTARHYRAAILQAAVLLATFVVIYVFFQTPPPEVADAMLQKVRSEANYAARLDYYEVFTNAFVSSRSRLWYEWYHAKILSFTVVVAVLAASTFLGRPWRGTLVDALAVLGACLAPLLLGFLGWDISRWFFLSLSSSVVALIGLRREPPAWAAAGFALLFALFAAFGHLSYFDGARQRSFGAALASPSRFVDFFAVELPHIVSTKPVL